VELLAWQEWPLNTRQLRALATVFSRRRGNRQTGMKRIVLETGLVVAVIVLGLEAVHYREAVLEANIDRNRAWNTVVQLREKCEDTAAHAAKLRSR
jgi:hypothetical protein